MKRRTFIYIPVWKNIKQLKECLQALKKNTSYPLYTIILIDDGNKESLKNSCPSLKVLRNRTNKGFTYCLNKARTDFLKRAEPADYFVTINSDTLPQEQWLTELISASQKYQDTGIFSALGLSFKNSNYVIGGGTRTVFRAKNSLIPLKNFTKQGDLAHFKGNIVNPWAEFAAVLITGKCLLKTGDFSNEFRHFGSDLEFCYRALKKGFKTRYIYSSRVIHEKQQSLTGMSITIYEDLKKLKQMLST